MKYRGTILWGNPIAVSRYRELGRWGRLPVWQHDYRIAKLIASRYEQKYIFMYPASKGVWIWNGVVMPCSARRYVVVMTTHYY